MKLLRIIWRELWLTTVVALVMLALYSSLGRQLMPLIENYRIELEQLLQEQLQQPVSIATLEGGWTGLSPVITLKNITIGGEQGLKIEHALMELDVGASLFYRQPVLNRFLLDGAQAQLQQLSATQWQLATGWIIDTADNDDKSSEGPTWPKWLSLQENIRVSSLALELQRLDHETEYYHIEKARWRSLGNQHELQANVALAQDAFSSIHLQASLQGELWPIQAHNGHLYLDIEQQNWAKWFINNDNSFVKVNEFTAAGKGWLEIKNGDLHAVYFQADIPALDIQRKQQQLRLTQGVVTIAGEHSDQDWHLQIHPHFAEPLPLSQLSFSRISAQDQTVWQLGVPQLDIGAAQQLLEKYQILPAAVAEFIDGTAPSGQAKNIRLSAMQDKHSKEVKFDVRADVNDVHSRAFHGIPALHGVNAKLQIQKHAGMVAFENTALDLHLASLYSNSWHLSELNGRFRWMIYDHHAELLLDDTSARLHEIEQQASWPVTAQLNISLPVNSANGSPSLGLLLGIASAPSSLQQQLVPDLVGVDTQEWLNQGILAGQVSNAVYALQTELGEAADEGGFSSLLHLDVSDATLHYLEGWPNVENINGTVYLNGADLDVQLSSATTLGGQLRKNTGHAKLRSKDQGVLLEISAGLYGDTGQAVQYFTQTPLQQVINHAFDHWQAKGRHNSDIYMRIALGEEAPDPDIWITSYITDNQLQLSDLGLEVEKLSGKISYSTAKGIESQQLNATLLGGDFSGQLASDVSGGQLAVNLIGTGQANWKNIRQWQPLFVFQPISGLMDYRAELAVVDGQTSIQLNTDLTGTQINLPSPYGKDAEQASPLAVTIKASDDLLIGASYQDNLQIKLQLDDGDIKRGHVALGGQTAQLPAQPVMEISGRVTDIVYLEQWWHSWQQLDFGEATANADAGPEFRINLDFLELDAWGTMLGASRLQANGAAQWKFQLQGPVVTGSAWLKSAQDPIQLSLDFINLSADEDADESADDDLDRQDPWQEVVPQELPAFNLSVNKVRIGQQDYGSWQITSRPTDTGLSLNILDSDIFSTKITGQLDWQYQDGVHQSFLQDIKITGKNIEQLQRGFSLPEFIEARTLTAEVDLHWPYSPLAMRLLEAEGQLQLDIRRGRLATESGAALKALGALNINSLSRRLKLDFSDLYKSGLTFDKLTADVALSEQTLTLTEAMQVDGPGGKFIVTGSAFLPTRELDMRVAVVLPVSTSLPLVAILAGLSPPVAASIFITEKLVGDELSRFTTANYTVTGDWQDPEMYLSGAFNQDGSKRRTIKQRILGIFGRDSD